MSNSNRTGNIFRVLVVVLIVGTLAGCMKTGTGNNSNSNNVSFITLMHMAPYSASVEVYFNGDKKTSAIAPGTFSTSYGQVPPGIYSIKFMVAGSTTAALDSLPASLFDSLGFYTLIIYNRTDSTVGSVKITDDYSNLSLTSANYRFFNLSPDAPSVDLTMNSTTAQMGRSNADNASLSYYNAFQPMAAGGYTLTAKKAGTDSVVATATGVNFQAGAAYTIFLSGKKNSTSTPITLNVLQAAY